jgi:UDP-2-acetamido-3-amino-2,3-dideoxy-glucuronate N-acetyltransferase
MSIAENAEIHPSAIVEHPVTVGEHTRIWHFCHVMAGAQIGADCSLGQNVFIASRVAIGNGCRIQNNVSVYDGVTLEDDVFLGPSCVFTNVANPRASVKRHASFLPTLVSRGATLGANSTIVAGNTIGRWAFVGAGCVVIRPVPDFALVVGNPAHQIGWMSRHGERLNFINGTAQCTVTGESYRLDEDRVEILSPMPAAGRQL